MAAQSRDFRHLWLVGLTGVGKTSIGKRLASTLEMPFLDTDAEVSRQCHLSIAELWDRHGEAAFRRLEVQAVEAAGQRVTPAIVATGGGAVLSEVSRSVMRTTGVVAWVTMDLDYLADRLAPRKRRPVLDGDLRTRLGDLMEHRHDLYAAVSDWVVDATYRSKDDVAADLAQRWRDRTIHQPPVDQPPSD